MAVRITDNLCVDLAANLLSCCEKGWLALESDYKDFPRLLTIAEKMEIGDQKAWKLLQRLNEQQNW